MTEPPGDSLHSQLDKLKRKADQQTAAHARLRDRYQFLNSLFSTISLIAGVFLLAIIMASPEFVERSLGLPADKYQWLAALLAAGSFSIVVVQLAWRPDARAALHDQAVRHYTKLAYRVSKALQGRSDPTESEVARIQDEYLDDRDLPRIPENKFLPLKQWHLRKVLMSKELDRRPYESLRAMRRRLESQIPPETKNGKMH